VPARHFRTHPDALAEEDWTTITPDQHLATGAFQRGGVWRNTDRDLLSNM